MTNEKLIDRIRKILARSKSANVHEAATAAALAHQMMLDNKISEADVAGFESEIKDNELEGEGFLAAWRFGLITAIAESCFCRTLRILENRKAIIRIIGLPTDFQTCKTIYGFVAKEIDRLCGELMKDGDRAKRDSFRRGATIALQHRLLAQMSRFARSSEKALVLVRDNKRDVDSFIKKNYEHRERDTDLGQAEDQEALGLGYAAGHSIPIPGRDDGQSHGFDDDLDDPEPNIPTDLGPPVYVSCVIEVRLPAEYERMPVERFIEKHVTDPEFGVRFVRVTNVANAEEN